MRNQLSSKISSIYRVIFLANFCLTHLALACPNYINVAHVSQYYRVNPKELNLVAYNKTLKQWRLVPFDIVPLTDDGRFELNNHAFAQRSNFNANDRIVTTPGLFGDIAPKSVPLPCSSELKWLVNDKAHNTFAYLVACKPKTALPVATQIPIVQFDDKQLLLSSTQYRYKFKKTNHMLFDSIEILGKDSKTIATNSDLTIKSDFKNFFTMYFDSSDIESELEDYYIGDVGVYARVRFFLKILFFRIKLELFTDVSFFENSAHIPMVVTIPAPGPKYLNPASGIFYAWDLPRDISINNNASNMPRLRSSAPPKLDPKISTPGYDYQCKSQRGCNFALAISTSDNTLQMRFNVPTKLADVGFYPQYVDDVELFKNQLDWDRSTASHGLFFSTANLPEGSHEYDFWMTMSNNIALAQQCPTQVFVQRIKDAKHH